ncbi:hypothetical protein M438DRAFT_103611 [Aureobasidium pullulans EXF-150]|uniref:Uncharacterized protein n=1 Tax=Aureobasidium pullulans EXF-150 TaxID=1043002 RepID=A0A074X639_AURPU|nr:uncharacterized protein M438DRAFT_103611 [Aureobasidium pullulans EXF-150]KEQ80858.1 hypothetical protein M438DRAFT_103611 [Aureobasidium pullulans EXF-150]
MHCRSLVRRHHPLFFFLLPDEQHRLLRDLDGCFSCLRHSLCVRSADVGIIPSQHPPVFLRSRFGPPVSVAMIRRTYGGTLGQLREYIAIPGSSLVRLRGSELVPGRSILSFQ